MTAQAAADPGRPKVDPEILRGQRLAACEVAFQGITQRWDGPLKWFTREVLKLPERWHPYVAMALSNSNWRTARNPFGYIRRVTVRQIKNWNPSLIGEDWREREPNVTLATDLAKVSSEDGWGYREGAAGALAFYAHLAEDGGAIDRTGKILVGDGHRRNGRRWRNPSRQTPPRKKPGECRLGPDDRALIDARVFAGCTRQTAAAYLGWPQSKVEAVSPG